MYSVVKGAFSDQITVFQWEVGKSTCGEGLTSKQIFCGSKSTLPPDPGFRHQSVPSWNMETEALSRILDHMFVHKPMGVGRWISNCKRDFLKIRASRRADQKCNG
jgi:hypothetical protein